jgi:hypothetical protein
MSVKVADYWIVAAKISPKNKNTYSRLYVRPYIKNYGLDKVVELTRKEFMALLKSGKSFICARYFPETKTYEYSGSVFMHYNDEQRKAYLWEIPYTFTKDYMEDLPEKVPDDWD